MYLVPSPYLCFLIAFGFNLQVLVRQCDSKGPNSSFVLVLNAKGDKLRPKQLDQLPLVNFSKVFSVRNTLLQKMLSYGGEI
jgi:hypothetical protein